MTVLLLFLQPASQLSGTWTLIYDRTAVVECWQVAGDGVGVGVGTPWIVTTGAVPFPAYRKVEMCFLLCHCPAHYWYLI